MRKVHLTILALFSIVWSCDLLDPAQTETQDNYPLDPSCGEIAIRFCPDNLLYSTKAGETVQLDTNSFILNVSDASGNLIYNGKYCESPSVILADPGNYKIRVVSAEFSTPAFSKPQWGDEQTVNVVKGQRSDVLLVCRQINCGVKLSIASGFLTQCSGSSLLLKSNEGKLLYSYSEKRVAYFKPGVIQLVMSTGSTDEVLLTRSLCSGEILNINVKVSEQVSSSSDGGGISLQVDTTRTYLSETYTIGGKDSGTGKGKSTDDAFTISQARNNIGKEDVWVGGYIVGGDLTSKSISFKAPFTSATAIAIGPKSNTATREDCLSVQLPSGSIRDALCLTGHPDRLGEYVYLRGDIVASYYGLVGMKNITEYKYK